MWGNRNKEFKTVQGLLVFERGKETGFLSNEKFKRKSKLKNIISVPPFSTIYIRFCTCFRGEMPVNFSERTIPGLGLNGPLK